MRTLNHSVSDTNNVVLGFLMTLMCCLVLSPFPLHLLLSSSDSSSSWNHDAALCTYFLFFPNILFFRGFVVVVIFQVFWAFYLQLYFSKIELEAMFWITASRSQLFPRAMPWNPFKILIEFQFDETVKPIKFSAPAFSTTQPFSSYPTWTSKILLHNSRLNLLMTNFYLLSRWQRSPGASLALVPLYCFPFPTFSIFMCGNQILSQHLLSEFIHAKLCHKLDDKKKCKNSWIRF